MLRLFPPGMTMAPPPVKAERSEPKGSLDKGVQWESTAGKPPSAAPWPKAIPKVALLLQMQRLLLLLHEPHQQPHPCAINCGKPLERDPRSGGFHLLGILVISIIQTFVPFFTSFLYRIPPSSRSFKRQYSRSSALATNRYRDRPWAAAHSRYRSAVCLGSLAPTRIRRA